MTALTAGSTNNFLNNALVNATTPLSRTNGAHVSFTLANTGSVFMIGLNSLADLTNTSYASIDYAIYVSGTSYYIQENGVDKGYFGKCAAGDTFVISYPIGGSLVKYYHNGEFFYQTTVSGLTTVPLYLDSSFRRYGSSVTNLCFSGYLAPALAVGSAANMFGKIFPGNIANYMSNAVIGNAYIADLAVDTLQIAGNAVTISTICTSSTITYMDNGSQWYDYLTSPQIPIIGLGTVVIQWTPMMIMGGAPSTVYGKISYSTNSTDWTSLSDITLGYSSISAIGSAMASVSKLTLSAGNYYFKLSLLGSSGAGTRCLNATMLISEFKK